MTEQIEQKHLDEASEFHKVLEDFNQSATQAFWKNSLEGKEGWRDTDYEESMLDQLLIEAMNRNYFKAAMYALFLQNLSES